MFIKLRHIPNRRFFNDLRDVFGIANSITYYLRAPPFAPLGTSKVNRVALHHLPYKHAVSQVDRIATYTPLDEARSIVALHDGHRAHAVAALEDKENHTEDKEQVRRFRYTFLHKDFDFDGLTIHRTGDGGS